MLCNSCGCNLGNLSSGYCTQCGGFEKLIQQRNRHGKVAAIYDPRKARDSGYCALGNPAPFANRLAAYIIDSYFLGLLYLSLGLIASVVLSEPSFSAFRSWIEPAPLPIRACGFIISGNWIWILLAASLPAALYYSLFESSPLRATPGKWWFGLETTDEFGGRLDPLMALLRFFARYFYLVPGFLALSMIWLPLIPMLFFFSVPLLSITDFLSPIVCARRRAIHDMLSGTVVEEYYVVRPVRKVLGYLVAFLPVLAVALLELTRLN